MSTAEVGVLRQATHVEEKEVIEWQISSSDHIPPYSNLNSPIFMCFGEKWYLQVHTNGILEYIDEDDEDSCIQVSLSLWKLHSSSEVSVWCTLGIKKPYGFASQTFDLRRKCRVVKGYHDPSCLIERCGLKSTGAIDRGQILIVSCVFRLNESDAEACGLGTLSKHLRESFITGSHSDIKISVKGKEFSAHKVILAARSPVFRSMLELDMKERNENFININDSDPESFEDFLLFLYSGKLDIVSPSTAISLYIMSDKYNVEELKKLCAIRLAQSVTVNSVLDVIQLAIVYNETDLLDTAKEFLEENANTIFKTQKWFSFMTENPSLANELLIEITDI